MFAKVCKSPRPETGVAKTMEAPHEDVSLAEMELRISDFLDQEDVFVCAISDQHNFISKNTLAQFGARRDVPCTSAASATTQQPCKPVSGA